MVINDGKSTEIGFCMTFEEALWHFERISKQFPKDGDLDIELIVSCMQSFERSPEKMNSDLAKILYRQLKILEEEFEKQRASYKSRLFKIREGRHALYRYRDKNLKVNNRFLYKNI